MLLPQTSPAADAPPAMPRHPDESPRLHSGPTARPGCAALLLVATSASSHRCGPRATRPPARLRARAQADWFAAKVLLAWVMLSCVREHSSAWALLPLPTKRAKTASSRLPRCGQEVTMWRRRRTGRAACSSAPLALERADAAATTLPSAGLGQITQAHAPARAQRAAARHSLQTAVSTSALAIIITARGRTKFHSGNGRAMTQHMQQHKSTYSSARAHTEQTRRATHADTSTTSSKIQARRPAAGAHAGNCTDARARRQRKRAHRNA